MNNVKPLWLILFVLGVLCFSSFDSFGQQDPVIDPWQFPTLTQSMPFQRWWWAFRQRSYPLADLPQQAKLRAIQELEAFRASQLPTTQAVTGDTWVNIGPAPLNGGQIGATGFTRPMSGRVAAIAVDPGNANHWLVGGAQGGVWQTSDAGATWTSLTDAQASLAMGAIAFSVFPNQNTIYAGTGEAAFSSDAYAGAGLLKSSDGGASWQLLGISNFSKTSFSDIKVHPNNPQNLLVATSRGSAGRVGGSLPSPPPTGIFKSTDGGITWSQRLTGAATALDVHPTSFANQYAGIGEIFGSSANGVYRSIDEGITWTLISGPWSSLAAGVGRVEVAISPSNANTVYVSIQDAFNSVGTDGGLLGLFRTDNAWDPTPTWNQISTGATDNGTGLHGYCGWDKAFNSPSDQCWYNHKIIVDPTDSNTLYAGGIPLWKCTSCTSAAASWTEVSKTSSNPTNGIHVDQHAMAWAGTRLLVGNDGGVWSTTDGGVSWADHNTSLSITQFYYGSIHPSNANFALAGSQDNGTEKWTGTSAWQWINGGDGGASAISSSNPNTNWAVSSQGLDIRRTTNGGITFIAADLGIDKTEEPTEEPGVAFIAPLEKCPANDDIFIAGTDNVWRSNNFFTGFIPFWTDNNSGNVGTIVALSFAASDTACNTYALGTGAGALRLTRNGGTTWTDIDLGNAVPNRAVTDLAFDPTNPNVLYVTLSGFDEGTPGQPGHVFKSSNALAASPMWSNVSPPVNIPSNTIAVDSVDPNIVWVGTDLGVWKSTTGGSNWIHMGPESGMPNVAVFDLKINNATGRLVAFTHGRGAFVLTSTPPVIAVSPTSQNFGNVNVNASADRDFTVQNVGGGTLTGTASTSSPFSILSGGSYSLTAGQTQTVTVRFSPSSTGTFLGNVIFTGGGGATAMVTGVGVVTPTLTVASSNPNNGVSITVSPNDNNGQGSGTTQFTRTYNNNTAVTLTAAATAGGNNFSAWTGCDSTSGSGGIICNVTMTSDRTVTALYTGQWTFCANENQVCSFTGTKLVRYGASTSFNYQIATNGINCDNATFGDPIVGVVKHCDYTNVSTLRTLTIASSNPNNGVSITVSPNDNSDAGNGTTQFTRTYNENAAVTLTAPATAGGNSFSNWTNCDSSSGTTCNVVMTANKIVTAVYSGQWTFCANENQVCSFTGAKLVRYGGSTSFNYRTATNSINCDNAMFGDPIVGTAKHCDYADPSAVKTLTIGSSNPNSGVSITVSPPDTSNAGTGITQFVRAYSTNTAVNLTAATTAGGNNFSNWTGCDSTSGTGGITCNLTMSSDRTVTAIYAGGIWTFCADENGFCSFTGTKLVRYGANGVFAFLTATNGISCNNATFGDPIVGTAKHCDYTDVPATWTFCADENQVCAFTGTKLVRYGAGSTFNYQSATNSISCDNATFGDPIVGTVKHCDYTDAPTQTAAAGP